jgi:hypothetical protein
MACDSADTIAELRELLSESAALVAVLQALTFELTGAVLCRGCYGLIESEHCPRCTGLEGHRWSRCPRGS